MINVLTYKFKLKLRIDFQITKGLIYLDHITVNEVISATTSVQTTNIVSETTNNQDASSSTKGDYNRKQRL